MFFVVADQNLYALHEQVYGSKYGAAEWHIGFRHIHEQDESSHLGVAAGHDAGLLHTHEHVFGSKNGVFGVVEPHAGCLQTHEQVL